MNDNNNSDYSGSKVNSKHYNRKNNNIDDNKRNKYNSYQRYQKFQLVYKLYFLFSLSFSLYLISFFAFI